MCIKIQKETKRIVVLIINIDNHGFSITFHLTAFPYSLSVSAELV